MTSKSFKANKTYSEDESMLYPFPKTTADDLIKEAKTVRVFLENFDAEFNNPENLFFYIISSRWLLEWKQYTSYDNVTHGLPPDEEHFGKINPSKINQDIVLSDYHITKYPAEDDERNVVLRRGLEEGRDYVIITEGAWRFFAARYPHITIKRPAHVLAGNKKIVEVLLMQISIISATNGLFKNIDHRRIHQFPVHSLQVSAYTTIKDFKNDVVEIFNSKLNTNLFPAIGSFPCYDSYEVSEDRLHLWLLDPALDLGSFFREVRKACNDSTTYNYQIKFKGLYLEKESSLSLKDLIPEFEGIIFLDSRGPDKGWTFFGDGAKVLHKCEFCSRFRDLPVVCDCKRVAYCSEECLKNDKGYHAPRCPN